MARRSESKAAVLAAWLDEHRPAAIGDAEVTAIRERLARGEPMDIWKIAVMATPVKFDDGAESLHLAASHRDLLELAARHERLALVPCSWSSASFAGGCGPKHFTTTSRTRAPAGSVSRT